MAAASLDFSASVDAWVKETKARQTAVFRLSADLVVDYIVANAWVDTGFARASLQAIVNGPLPSLSRERPGGLATGSVPAPSLSFAIANADIGDFISIGFSANYVQHLEFGHGNRPPRPVVRAAAAQWQAFVSQATAKAKAAVASNRR